MRGEASKQSKRAGSIVAAVVTFLIFTWAIRSCVSPEITPYGIDMPSENGFMHGRRLQTNNNGRHLRKRLEHVVSEHMVYG